MLFTNLYILFFIKAVRYMYINFLFTKVLYLLSYMDICISIILYLFLLFTGKQHCLHNFGDLPAMNICLHAKFQVWWCYDFDSAALQQD